MDSEYVCDFVIEQLALLAIPCLPCVRNEAYSIWRAIDLLIQAGLTGEYEHSPVITADNTLTLLKKETGIG